MSVLSYPRSRFRDVFGCPSRVELQKYARGKLLQAASEIELHLGFCQACQDTLDTLESDSLTEAIGNPLPDPIEPAQIQRILYGVTVESTADTTILAAAELCPGLRLGNYRIQGLLGKGGMGSVFLAEELHLERLVALKVVHPERLTSDEKERLLYEAKTAAKVSSKHLAEVFACDEIDGTPFIAFKYLKGKTLHQAIAEQAPFSLDEICRLGSEICQGLNDIHQAGFVHRDLKPRNILIEESSRQIKILDFGLAVEHEPSGDDEPVWGGTPRYMSPEQAAKKPIDYRSDLFSLGSVLYEMATGDPPFQGETVTQLLASVQYDVPCTPSELAEIEPHLSALIMELLSKDPQERPSDANAVMTRLSDIQKFAAKRKTQSRVGRNFIRVALIVLMLLGLMFTAYQVLVRVKSERGTIELRINNSEHPLQIDVSRDHTIQITDPSDDRLISIRVDRGKDQLILSKDGFEIQTSHFLAQLRDGTEIQAKLIPTVVTIEDIPESLLPTLAIPFAPRKAQQSTADDLNCEVEIENSIGMKLRLIPAGRFLMGLDIELVGDQLDSSAIAHAHSRGATVPHEVIITQPFYAATTELTVEQFKSLMPDHFASNHGASNDPATFISWNDAAMFCNELSKLEGLQLSYEQVGETLVLNRSANGYRLPTEAEWEFMYRAGSSDVFPHGKSDLHLHAWFRDNAEDAVHPVAQLEPNGFGLYDMGGNVWEWCHDWFDSTYYLRSKNDTIINPIGPNSGERRVVRGADFSYSADSLRSSLRSRYWPTRSGSDIGVRPIKPCEINK